MSDANVKQSVERCKYRHDWASVDGKLICAKCCRFPNMKEMKEAEAIVHLREMLKPGDTVYTVLRHVSRSGMTRGIDCYMIADNKPQWITGYVGHAIGSPQPEAYWRKSMGLKIGGCGMDMGFHIVYTLSRVLFHEIDAKHDGGYALMHGWL